MTDDDRLRAAINYYRRSPYGPLDNHLKALLEAGEIFLCFAAFAKGVCTPPPAAKEIDVWHVEWCDGDIPHIDDPYLTRVAAEANALRRMNTNPGSRARVTGPHKHTVKS